LQDSRCECASPSQARLSLHQFPVSSVNYLTAQPEQHAAERRLQQTLLVIGSLSSLFGLALMARYGLTFQSQFEFNGALQSASVSAEAWRRHTRELRGRFGLLLAVIGAAMSAGCTGLVTLPF
jgi:hypothetical protein